MCQAENVRVLPKSTKTNCTYMRSSSWVRIWPTTRTQPRRWWQGRRRNRRQVEDIENSHMSRGLRKTRIQRKSTHIERQKEMRGADKRPNVKMGEQKNRTKDSSLLIIIVSLLIIIISLLISSAKSSHTICFTERQGPGNKETETLGRQNRREAKIGAWC